MARRRLPDEPNSKLAVWSRRFALFSVAAALIAIIIVRAGLLEVLPGIVTFAGALAFGAIGILLALLSLITIWRQGLSGLGYSVTAIAVGGAAARLPGLSWLQGVQAAADLRHHHRHSGSRRHSMRSGRCGRAPPIRSNMPVSMPPNSSAKPIRKSQRSNCTVSPKIAYEHALALVHKRRWLVMDAREPHPGRREGRIEAVARTPVMGFREDVVIRVRGTEEEAARRYAVVLALRISRHRQQCSAHPRLSRRRRGIDRRGA